MSLLDTALGYMSLALKAAALTGKSQGRHGLGGPGGIVPNEGFETADGVLVVTAGTDVQFAKLCAALDHPEWAQDERFSTARGRHGNAPLLRELLVGVLCTRTRAEWMALLDAQGAPSSPVFASLETLEHPQTQACGMIQAGAEGDTPQIGVPIMIDGERLLRSEKRLPVIVLRKTTGSHRSFAWEIFSLNQVSIHWMTFYSCSTTGCIFLMQRVGRQAVRTSLSEHSTVTL